MFPAHSSGSANTWSSADLPPRDRLEGWHPVLARAYARFDHLTSCDDFRLSLTSRTVGSMRLVACRSSAGSGRRTPRVVRLDDERRFGVQVILAGQEWLACGDNGVLLEPGSVIFWDSAMASEFAVKAPIDKATVVFSESVLRERLPRDVALTSQRIDARRGIGAVLRAHVVTLVEELDAFDADDANLRNATIDLLAATLVRRSPEEAADPGLAHTKRERIQAYIRAHLADPDLSPATIACENGISLRYLHLLFHRSGTTVAAWVKEQRLLRCYDELSAAAHGSEGVAEVAFRHGFADPANFSRDFKRRFGRPRVPSEPRADGAFGLCILP